MTTAQTVLLIGLEAIVAEYMYEQLQTSEEPVSQAQICDFVTQTGEHPLPMEALENLVHKGIIENPLGEPTPASNGEPVPMLTKWVLSRYGEGVVRRHLEKKAKEPKTAPEAKPAAKRPAKPEPVQMDGRRAKGIKRLV